ncbi:hypothetical protein FWP33_25545 [Vibrio parahaemolyticus]|uniref:ParB N-terminal domain-containing protein n=1 Tax=Vibrio parahaemolyticus TaxID=670 RepID=A0A9Q3YG00_VIBPH|nr:ParB N-terminal domain-containing protein [Vibrio parahaemolyticus]EGQ9745861.1 hypothetical protein [Vibrio parahaemolyticus]EJC7176154.1 ParB N-terminal domain-containing protein [Vibrio parahaemolyticus]EJE4724593.1 ParB N-terminal domain-containing protein [Vibrio parahaemolyticus]EJG0009887.1 ParB N-terminal domain-containing protein [Vibrio parahaemolyticus]EJO2025958.1 ParB N-terminal domain-containing protein [Vibrio parahaemolyticus]
MTAHNTAQSGTRRGPRTQGRSDNSRHQMEGEIRNIAGKRKVRFRDITLSPDEVKVNVSISKYNPRILTSVNDRHVFQLSENIKRNGQLMPVWAYMSEGKYLILDGSRRKRATTDANLPLNIKLIEGDFTEKDLRRIAHALAMSEGMSFIELAAIWYKEIEDLKAEGKFESISEYCKERKLSKGVVSEALRAHVLPESLKNAFPRITTVGRARFVELFKVADLMQKAIDNGEIYKVRKFEDNLLTEIDIEEIIYELESKEREKCRADYQKRLIKAQRAENALAKQENREPIAVDVEHRAPEVNDNVVNTEVMRLIHHFLVKNDLVPHKKASNDAVSTIVDSSEPRATSTKIKGGVRVDLVNLGKQKEKFAVEVNEAIVNANTKGRLTYAQVDEAASKLKELDSSEAQMLMSIINSLATKKSSKNPPDNVSELQLEQAS